jgi:DNA repair exonuclease SbcCD nuclease subunit
VKRSLRLLHAADLHLDGDAYGNADQQVAHRARERRVFQQVIARALADDVDLVLIAGDLFDHNRVSDDTVAFVRGELARLHRPVVLLPGNHDCLEPQGVHDRHDFTAGAPHVHVIRRLDGEVVELPALDAVVWGRGMQEHVPTFQPLAHVPPRDGGRWALAMGHGFFYPERERPERSSPIFADEIRATGWDYVALGHHHLQADVSQPGVTAWYAGAPGTVLRVELSEARGILVAPRAVGA